MVDQQIEVTNNAAEEQYQARIDGHLALIQYEMRGDTIVYLHTEVPPELEGRGIASALAKAALEDAQARGLTVIPLCPFVSTYLRRHHEYLPLVDPPYRARLG
jgi:predicted GNAT family acetyltransferase